MICTEEEALSKWCPQARVATNAFEGSGDPVAVNRENSWARVDGNHCIGSACMMWDWMDALADVGKPCWVSDNTVPAMLSQGYVLTDNHADYAGRVEMILSERRGTCGLIQRGGE